MESFIYPEHGIEEFDVALSSFISEISRIPDSGLLICIPASTFPFHSISITFESFRENPLYIYQEESGNSYFCTISASLRNCCLKLMEKVRIAVKRIMCLIPGGDIQIANCQFAL